MASDHTRQLASLLWPPARPPASIEEGEVHLWAWPFNRTGEPAPEDLSILDDFERARTARFKFSTDQVRYSVCHANMRRILASYLHQPPESLAFREAFGGKPELDSESARLRFNLSHSRSLAALAVALDMEVGVDVEDVRPIEADVAKRYFSPAEFARLATLSGQSWLDAFYRCWTRKEAILKAEGVGLRIPLDAFEVSLLAGEPATLLAARPRAKLTAHWSLHHLAIAPGTMGALAVANPSAKISAAAFEGSHVASPD
jgi:4'-phosphopantetheinyl transferase